MPTTPLLGFRYPSRTDYPGSGPDVPRAVGELALDRPSLPLRAIGTSPRKPSRRAARQLASTLVSHADEGRS